MTFTYALVADSGVVLAADSELTYTHSATEDFVGEPFVIGTFQSKTHKIKRLPNGIAFSVAGNQGLIERLLSAIDTEVNLSFMEAILQFHRALHEEYEKMYPENEAGQLHCDFLFAGYQSSANRKAEPLLAKLSSRDRFSLNFPAWFDFTGRQYHGAALYLHHRLASEGMPLEAAKRLVYCVLAEVAMLDNMCGTPIEMVVVTSDGIANVPQAELEGYEETRKRVVDALQAAFSLSAPAVRGSTDSPHFST